MRALHQTTRRRAAGALGAAATALAMSAIGVIPARSAAVPAVSCVAAGCVARGTAADGLRTEATSARSAGTALAGPTQPGAARLASGGGHPATATAGASSSSATSTGISAPALETPGPSPSSSTFLRHPGPISSASPFMRTCGIQFCIGAVPFYPYGATFYQSSPQSGFDNPAGAVQLARLENLNTIRVVNFYNPTSGDPVVTPFSDAVWSKVDTLIADAQAAGIRVVLDLADYRNILMDHCTNPYTYDWTRFLTFVAQRVNHVSGKTYASDPEIVMVSFSGEPLPVGTHGCISYTTQDLTTYFHNVASTWKSLDPNHLVTAGGLGYLNFNSGIDWRAIVADPSVDVCAFKTYGGMMGWLGTGAAYCAGTLGKPWFNDEWGYTQSDGDATMATEFQAQFDNNGASGAAANFFWNAGYQSAPTTYDVGPQMPLTMAAVQRNARPLAGTPIP